MKIALNKIDDNIRYSVVPDDYDFSKNGCTDETCIRVWYQLLDSGGCDIVLFRDEVKKLVGSVGWDFLSDFEKRVVASTFVVDKIHVDSFFTLEKQEVLMYDLIKGILEERNKRILRVKSLLCLYLVPVDYSFILDGVSHLTYRYVELGDLSILDYISTAIRKKVVPIEGTKEDLIKKLESVLK